MLYAFGAWTMFVWGTRLSNGAEGLALVVAVTFLVLALAVVVTARPAAPAWPITTLAMATLLAWAVRAPLILADADHAVGFKLVHTALAVVSCALAVAAWRRTRRPAGRPASEPTAA